MFDFGKPHTDKTQHSQFEKQGIGTSYTPENFHSDGKK